MCAGERRKRGTFTCSMRWQIVRAPQLEGPPVEQWRRWVLMNVGRRVHVRRGARACSSGWQQVGSSKGDDEEEERGEGGMWRRGSGGGRGAGKADEHDSRTARSRQVQQQSQQPQHAAVFGI